MKIKFFSCVFFAGLLVACSSHSPEKMTIISFSGCSVDWVDAAKSTNPGAFEIAIGAPASARGWIADVPNARIPKDVSLVLVDKQMRGYLVGATSEKMPRPDVGAAFNNSQLDNSGFNIKLDMTKVPAGEYVAHLNVSYENFNQVCLSAKPWVIK